MGVRTADIQPRILSDIVEPCRACCYWECPERFTHGKHTEDEAGIKAEWFEGMSAHFEPCGKILYVDDPAVYCQYAPPEYIPGVSQYRGLAAHVDRDGVFISCLFVAEAHRRSGLGSRMLTELIADVRNRGFRTIETFSRDDCPNNCSGPTRFYRAHGFAVVATTDYAGRDSFSLVRRAVAS